MFNVHIAEIPSKQSAKSDFETNAQSWQIPKATTPTDLEDFSCSRLMC